MRMANLSLDIASANVNGICGSELYKSILTSKVCTICLFGRSDLETEAKLSHPKES